MDIKTLSTLIAGALLLSGCAGVKGDFDCDATTSDRCMTMSQANQVARDKTEGAATGKPGATALPSLADMPTPVRSVSSSLISTPVMPARAVAVPTVAAASAPTVTPLPLAPSALLPDRRVPVYTPSTRMAAHLPVVPVTTVARPVPVTPPASLRAAPVSTASSACSTPVCGDNRMWPTRTPGQVMTVWIAPWIDSDDRFHQPARVSFVDGGNQWSNGSNTQ